MATLKKGGAALTAQDQADFRDGLGLTGALTLTESGLTKGGVALTSAEMQSLRLGAGIVISEDPPSDADGRPDGTIYIQVGA